MFMPVAVFPGAAAGRPRAKAPVNCDVNWPAETTLGSRAGWFCQGMDAGARATVRALALFSGQFCYNRAPFSKTKSCHLLETTSMTTNGSINRKLRMALCGGGQGAFIGRVHATAAVLDNRAVLVAGALSSDPQKAKASAPDYDIPAARAYGSYKELFEKEKALPAEQRIDFVSVATPNHTHFEIALAAVEAGFNCMCDKPMTFDLAQAEKLAEAVDKAGVVFAVTHNYTGYPLVRQAREMILSGELGEINAIRSFYIQGWLRSRLEAQEQKQASWRTDPKRSGAAGCFGDIATHAYNLARYMTGVLPAEISCHLKTFAQGRQLDDYGTAVIRFENGALGTVTASQISHGRENDIFIEIDGTKCSLQWHQENPNLMFVRANGQPHKT